ncbi:MAG TPA: class I SAM-dependent methyltransferase, partial [Polyangiaceae bacterium]|nr:class I SAM-dependent methyltransferase [Polyangiaceae bacterium]
AVIARMFGLTPAAPERSRILDLGCADGSHLLALALEYPNVQCVGIDRSAEQIERGQRAAAELGVKNLVLRAADLGDAIEGEFDYVTAHGVYSWVDAPARERLLATMRKGLAPNGVGYLSYESLPGAYPRLAARNLLLPYVQDLGSAGMGTRFRAIAQAVAECVGTAQPFSAALKLELLRASRAEDSAVAHDWCSDVHEAVYFRDFARHLEQHELTFVTDTPLLRSGASDLSEAGRRVLSELSRTRVERQQLIDMLADNSYRESLVVRADSNPRAEPDFQAELEAAQISTLLLLRDGEQGALQIRNHRGWQTSVSEPLVKDAVVALTQASPRALTFADLTKGLDLRSRAALGRGLFDLFAAGFIDLRRDAPRCAIRPGARPQASALCRWQSSHRTLLTDVYHYSVKVQEERSRRLIALLDGTRDRAALVADWSSFGTAGEIDEYLDRFARLRLLVA